MSSPSPEPQLTEDDIADYLLATPDFFARHAQLLASVQLTSPHHGRAVSLADRQIEMLRDKLKVLELKHGNLLRVGKENVTLAGKLHQWMLGLLCHQGSAQLSDHLTASLQSIFDVPQAVVIQGAAAMATAEALVAPRCGLAVDAFFQNAGVIAAFTDTESVHSLALMPLPGIGLLALASQDPNRFTADMGTEFLTRLGELAHAALA